MGAVEQDTINIGPPSSGGFTALLFTALPSNEMWSHAMLSSVLQCAAQLQTGLWDDSCPIAILYAIGHDKSGEPEMAIHCNTTPLCTVDMQCNAMDGSMEASAQWTLNC